MWRGRHFCRKVKSKVYKLRRSSMRDIFKVAAVFVASLFLSGGACDKTELSSDASVAGLFDGITVSENGAVINFPFNHYGVQKEFKETLAAQAEYLAANPGLSVKIYGHTDVVGNKEYNVGLSAKRAGAVAKFLEASGVPSERIEIVALGATSPVAMGDSADAHYANRRAVLEYVPAES